MNFSTDLKKLLPSKFRTVQRLSDFLQSVGEILDEMKTKVDDLSKFRDPDTIPEAYIQYLANLFGYQILRVFRVGSEQEVAKRREALRSIPTLILQKGVKVGIKNVLYFFFQYSGIDIYELWSRDYVNFTENEPTEDDPRFDEFYLSPHFGVLFSKNAYFDLGDGDASAGKAVVAEMLTRIKNNQPAHEVLHFDLGRNDEGFWRVGGTWTSPPDPWDGFPEHWRIGGDEEGEILEGQQARVCGYRWLMGVR